MTFSALFPIANKQSLGNKANQSETSFDDLICLVRLFLDHLPYVHGYNGKFYDTSVLSWGTWWRSWLRHCATSRKVVGLIPDDVTGMFY